MSVNISQPTFTSRSWQGLGLLLVSVAALTFQINLTRMFSVSQFYHFAFMAVSIALLGMGASGTFLALRKIKPGEIEEKIFPWLAIGTGASMLAAYLLVNHLPFDAFSIFVDPVQILILLLQYAVLASPFFLSGMLVSMLLRTYSVTSGEIYAVNLVGSALGCLSSYEFLQNTISPILLIIRKIVYYQRATLKANFFEICIKCY